MKRSSRSSIVLIAAASVLALSQACTRSKPGTTPGAAAVPSVVSAAPTPTPSAAANPIPGTFAATLDGKGNAKAANAVDAVKPGKATKPVSRELPTLIASAEESSPTESTIVDPTTGSSSAGSLEAAVGIEGDESAYDTWKVGLTTGHASAFKEGVRDFTQFLAEIEHGFSSSVRVGVQQGFRKIYEIAPRGEKEFLAEDTLVYGQFDLSKDFLGTEVQLNAGATVPVSQQSRDDGRITRTSLGLTVKKALFNERLVVSATPELQYCFNEFGTSPAGVPLQRLAFVQGLEADLGITERLHLVGWGKGYYRGYEEFNATPVSPAATTSYGLGAYLGYSLFQNLGLQAGAVRGNSIFAGTRFDEPFYDTAEATRFYAAIKVNF